MSPLDFNPILYLILKQANEILKHNARKSEEERDEGLKNIRLRRSGFMVESEGETTSLIIGD